MADIDLDFLARRMERLLTEMQGMREEMGSIYAELNSMRAEMANMRDDMRSMRDEIRALSTTVPRRMAPCSPWRRSLAHYLDCSASNLRPRHSGEAEICRGTFRQEILVQFAAAGERRHACGLFRC